MWIVFPSFFVADTKITNGYNFVAPLIKYLCCNFTVKKFNSFVLNAPFL